MILTFQDGAGTVQAARRDVSGANFRVMGTIHMRDPDCVLSPDGRTLAVSEDGGVKLFEVAAGRKSRPADGVAGRKRRVRVVVSP